MNKKGLIALGLLVFLSLAGVYIFIPATLSISSHIVLRCNPAGAYRVLSRETFWYPTRGLRLTGKYYNAVTLRQDPAACQDSPDPAASPHVAVPDSPHIPGSPLVFDSLRVPAGDCLPDSRLTIFPALTLDSMALEWSCTLPAGSNPFTRIRRYRQAHAIKERMVQSLALLRNFLERKQNIYGIKVEEAMSPDSTLVATRLFSPAYPTTDEIYRMVSTLRQYIGSQNAKVTDYPMLHVTDHLKDSGEGPKRFETMVAIPANRRLPGNGAIFLKLFVPYKILIGETRGGPVTGELALVQLMQYKQDYQRTAMAIPFQQLVTERDQQPDTTQWITRVVVPVD